MKKKSKAVGQNPRMPPVHYILGIAVWCTGRMFSWLSLSWCGPSVIPFSFFSSFFLNLFFTICCFPLWVSGSCRLLGRRCVSGPFSMAPIEHLELCVSLAWDVFNHLGATTIRLQPLSPALREELPSLYGDLAELYVRLE